MQTVSYKSVPADGVSYSQVWPTLYKKTKTGAIQQWDISVDDTTIATAFGQVGGAIQETTDVIKTGKNTGRANATTAHEQAIAEAQGKWEKQVKKGYVEKIEDAQSGKTDLGGVLPMLAHKFSEHEKKLKYPCYVQPKLDGTRCIALIEDGNVTLWSRTRKPIVSSPHIVEELEAVFAKEPGTWVLDGELYNHSLKADFEKLVSLIRQTTKPHPDHKMIEYHVYDMFQMIDGEQVCQKQWLRFQNLTKLFEYRMVFTKRVETQIADMREDLMALYEEYMDMGYEGAMTRNQDGLYIHNRSHDLLKVKEFIEEEFKIVGVSEGRGKLQGHAGAFICMIESGVGAGQKFNAKLEGATERLKEIFENAENYIGKPLTVSFQNYYVSGIPRFPIGKAVRDYE